MHKDVYLSSASNEQESQQGFYESDGQLCFNKTGSSAHIGPPDMIRGFRTNQRAGAAAALRLSQWACKLLSNCSPLA
eukprot:3938535-Rhodomonas_salina.1